MTIELIDNIINDVMVSLYCMMEDEVGNCSIFFNEIWKSVNSWRYDNDAFPSELKDMVRLCHLCTKLISSDLCVTLIIEILSLLHLLLQPGSQLSAEFAHENGIGTHLLTTGITHDG